MKVVVSCVGHSAKPSSRPYCIGGKTHPNSRCLQFRFPGTLVLVDLAVYVNLQREWIPCSEPRYLLERFQRMRPEFAIEYSSSGEASD